MSKFQRTEGPSSIVPTHHALPLSTSSSLLNPIVMGRQASSGSNSGEESMSSSGFFSSGSSLQICPKSTTTNATSEDSRTSKSPPAQSSQSGLFDYMSTTATSVDAHKGDSPPSQSDPFGYLSDTSAMPAVPPLPTFDATAIIAQPFAQPPSGLFSPEGHYMPTRVNPLFPHAYITFGAGAKQKEIDVYSTSHPLPAMSIEGTPCFTPYHVPFSAHPVGSSVMLLGGFGFLSRLHGLSIDNLVEVEMVLADGSIVIVNETDHPGIIYFPSKEEMS